MRRLSEDEDFTLEVIVPPGINREEVMNESIRHAISLKTVAGCWSVAGSEKTIASD